VRGGRGGGNHGPRGMARQGGKYPRQGELGRSFETFLSFSLSLHLYSSLKCTLVTFTDNSPPPFSPPTQSLEVP
jgi:hypothetical protein